MSDVSELLRLLTKNERCELIDLVAQVAHQKRAIMSKSLRSLTKNERMSDSLVFLANRYSLGSRDEEGEGTGG